MAKTRTQKAGSLEELAKLFKEGKSFVFSDYQGMSVSKMTALRKALRGAKADYLVSKKTLLGLAAKQAGYEIDFSKLPGMLGVAATYEEEMAAAKIVGDAGKDSPIKLVGGIFEGKVVDQAYVIALSKLPTKKELLGQLLSVLNGPIGGFARVLNAYKEKQETSAA